MHYRRRALKSFALIALLGPLPIALLLIVVTVGQNVLTTPLPELMTFENIWEIAGQSAFLFLMTYLFGGIPTLFGALIVSLRLHWKGWLGKVEVLFLAFGSGFFGWFLLSLVSDTPFSVMVFARTLQMAVFYGLLGGISSLFLLPVLRRIGAFRKAL